MGKRIRARSGRWVGSDSRDPACPSSVQGKPPPGLGPSLRGASWAWRSVHGASWGGWQTSQLTPTTSTPPLEPWGSGFSESCRFISAWATRESHHVLSQAGLPPPSLGLWVRSCSLTHRPPRWAWNRSVWRLARHKGCTVSELGSPRAAHSLEAEAGNIISESSAWPRLCFW